MWICRFPGGLRGRLNELATCKKMRDETSLTEFMQKDRISWYILQTGLRSRSADCGLG